MAVADGRSATKTALLYNWPVTTVRKAFRRIRAGGEFYRWSSKKRSATAEKLSDMEQILQDDPQVSVRKMARASGLPRSTTWRVMHTYLNKHCYRRAKTLSLKVQHREQRLRWCKTLLSRLGVRPSRGVKVSPAELGQLVFMDEKIFRMDITSRSTQNCRFWSSCSTKQTALAEAGEAGRIVKTKNMCPGVMVALVVCPGIKLQPFSWSRASKSTQPNGLTC